MLSAFFTEFLCDVLDSSCDDFLLSVQFHQKASSSIFNIEDIQQRSFHCFVLDFCALKDVLCWENFA